MDYLSTAPQGIDPSQPPSSADVGELRAPERGASVGRYVLLDRLGAGGMGVVFAAWDPELDRRVAIKLISDRTPQLNRQLRARLRREAQAMARLGHPNVVKVFDVGEADGRLFVAMEFVQGVSLRRWLDSEERSGPEIVGKFREAAEGLAAAHAQGIVHRDFKPDNVLVADDGRVLVFDFGLASWDTGEASGSRVIETEPEQAGAQASAGSLESGRSLEPDRSQAADDREETIVEGEAAPSGSQSELLETNPGNLTAPGAVLGTPAYMPPEQHRGMPTDIRSDQFSFCAALWEALTGRLPFGRGPLVLARARTAKLGGFERRDVPPSVEVALRRGLAWQPDERWPDMRALLDALDPPVRKRRWVVAVAPVLACVLGLGVAQLSSRWSSQDSAGPGLCEDGRARMDQVWSEAVVGELAASFVDRGRVAEQTWPYLRAEIDRWTSSWVATDRDLCLRYGRVVGIERGVHHDQLACLDRQLGHLEQLVELLTTVSETEISKTFDLLATLPNPRHCREVGFASEREREPGVRDPEQLVELDRAIARAELELQLSRLDSVEHSSAELFEQTKTPGLEAQHQRVATLRARVLTLQRRPGPAIDVAISGLEAAERNGDPVLRLAALLEVAHMYAEASEPITAERWLRQAQALASVLTLDRSMRAKLASVEASVAMTDARFEEALAAWDRALAATVPDEDRFEYINRLHDRATVLFLDGQPAEGLDQLRRCEQMYGELAGPNHEAVLAIRMDIAHALETLGEYAASREAYLEVAEAWEQNHGGATDLSVACRSHAAAQLARLGDCENAIIEFDTLMEPARELMTYPSAVLGNLLRRRTALCQFSTPEAVDYATQAVALYREALTDEHVATAATYADLGIALLVAGEPQRALKPARRALELFEIVDPKREDKGGLPKRYAAEAVVMLARHELGEPNALDGAAELLEQLSEKGLLHARLSEAGYEKGPSQVPSPTASPRGPQPPAGRSRGR